MSALNAPVAVVATEAIQSIAIGIVYVICVGLMLVPVVAFAILVVVEGRALLAERRDRDAKAAASASNNGLEVATHGASR